MTSQALQMTCPFTRYLFDRDRSVISAKKMRDYVAVLHSDLPEWRLNPSGLILIRICGPVAQIIAFDRLSSSDTFRIGFGFLVYVLPYTIDGNIDIATFMKSKNGSIKEMSVEYSPQRLLSEIRMQIPRPDEKPVSVKEILKIYEKKLLGSQKVFLRIKGQFISWISLCVLYAYEGESLHVKRLFPKIIEKMRIHPNGSVQNKQIDFALRLQNWVNTGIARIKIDELIFERFRLFCKQ